MKGYYKEPNRTSEVLTEEGWLKTGDLGRIDRNGNIFIKGRIKNMILSSSGENIYPEEIESVINNLKYVVESLVIQKKGKLVALVNVNMDEIEIKYQALKQDVHRQVEVKIEEVLGEIKEYVNARIGKFCQIQMVINHPEPFQKTATMKIKRFLYT